LCPVIERPSDATGLPALRYPQSERTAELEARIEKTIARKVGEFIQERQAKVCEASLRRELAQRHPNLTEMRRLEYNQRILDLVAERRQEMARQKQRTPPARSQVQARGIER
jgi:hypothetical protein